MLADFFDTMGTMTAIGAEAGLLDEDGIPPNTQRILVVDSRRRGRRWRRGRLVQHVVHRVAPRASARAPAPGLASRGHRACCSCSAIFFAPLVGVIPSEAAVPALVLVGFLMMQQVKGIDWDDAGDRHPGVPDDRADAVHLLDHRRHRRRLHRLRADQDRSAARPTEVHPLLWVVAALFVVYFAIDPITDLLT